MFKDKVTREAEIIEQIHNEFDTAGDRLLAHSEKLLSELKIPTQTKVEKKSERLKLLGFTKTEDVSFAEKLTESNKKIFNKISVNKDQAELIKYYKRKYPFQKFLTIAELDRICEKWGLIYAPVSSYIKTVPEKNLSDIENAKKLCEKDIDNNVDTFIYTCRYQNYRSEEFIKTCKHIGFGDFSEKNLTLTLSSSELKKAKALLNDVIHRELVNEKPEDLTYYISVELVFGHGFSDLTIETELREGLFIAAPKSHFDVEDLNKTSKFGFSQVFKTEIKDPIVFRYCKGGIQVLTMWGDENFDPNLEPSLHNPINN
jgi:hypothetical protein